MRHFLLTNILLLLAISGTATNYTLTLYADECGVANQVVCQEGQQVRATAMPVAGQHFVRWSDGNTDNPRLVTINGNQTLTAEFAPDVCTVIIQSDGCGTQQTVIANNGIVLRITPSPKDGSHFTQWSDGNTDNPRTVVVAGDAAYTAEFEADALALDDTQDNTEELTAKIGQEVDVTLVGRTLLGGMWNTLCLPFDVPTLDGTPLNICQIANYVDATGNSTDGIDMHFEYVTALYAGIPYLVKPAINIVEPTFENVTIREVDGQAVSGSGNVSFAGVLKPVVLWDEAYLPYIMGQNNLIYLSGQGTFKAYRAYFDIVNPALHNAPLRVVMRDQTTTGIQAATAAAKVVKQIINGQMVIVREGKTYNALGVEL